MDNEYQYKRTYANPRRRFIRNATRLVERLENESGVVRRPIVNRPRVANRQKRTLRDAFRDLYRSTRRMFGRRRTYVPPNLRGENRRFMEEIARGKD